MGRIKVLPEEVVDKIAAGEVVERPSSVVKELVENALDAGSNQIHIDVEDGGMKKISVVDNGLGMDAEDLRLSLTRYGTSKLSSIEDLSRLNTFGFRGEALSSIGAISKLNLSSRQAGEDLGRIIKVHGGKIKKLEKIGKPIGTQVLVADLFYNIPARKKFLKSTATEFRHIAEVISSQALAHPEVTFSLTHNGKLYFEFATTELQERVRDVLGEDSADRLLTVFLDHPHLAVTGYVGRPEISTVKPQKQYLFVNGRPIKDSSLSLAVKKAYGTLLMPRSYPILVLYLTLPHEMVDVNVHPRKEEVAFVNRGSIFNSVKIAVERALSKEDLTYRHYSEAQPIFQANRSPSPSNFKFSDPPHIRSFEPTTRYQDQVLPWEKEFQDNLLRGEIIQVHNTYLVQQVEEGLLLVDQHAAHERILYERFLGFYKTDQDRKEVQPLLVPQGIKLSKTQSDLLEQNLTLLNKIGFEVELVDKLQFQIKSVPAVIKDRDLVSLITQFLSDFGSGVKVRDIDDESLRALTFLSCRSAVKAGDFLNTGERIKLLADLSKTKTEYTCPHGRPAKVEISLRELEKMFKRTL